ncbi:MULTISPECIES: CcoQ/FixQ family Cbb3-type cytochrome c oxidase assembly chaperone [Paracoccus]|uniref:CcoQ/FixQ family Cbb3-type cytochrome c oxidase assembly chaperone n=1 Tax=Paracoccus TaxID=265 RepID=UPI0003768DFA|nr:MULTISPECIES: CcoQ/FixQ family Cbb3-type cytochrome c oxidase assembly chaperone [Paracoccus]MCV2448225.1 CcoQ/FixQ family Cbb3-type cytochrome c oxidase assembly chaperone [Paracoccus sp. DMF]
MEIYSFLRELADSWVLLSLVLFFLGAIAFVLRPGSRRLHRDAAESIFRNETSPATAGEKEVE